MPDQPKVYKSRYAQHNLTLNVKGKRFPVLFHNGEYATSDPEVQKQIESLSVFHTGVIVVKSQAEIDAEAKAKAEHLASLKPHVDAATAKAQDAAKAKAAQVAADKASAEANAKAQADLEAKNLAIKNGAVARAAAEKKAAAAKAKAEADAATAAVQGKDQPAQE